MTPTQAAAGTATVDPHDVRRAREAPGLLRDFNDAGVLAAADVHVARRLAGLAPDLDPADLDPAHRDAVLLAIALAVRAPRMGHVCVDLAQARDHVAAETDDVASVEALPWPAVDRWLDTLRSCTLVAAAAADADADADADVEAVDASRPVRLVATRLYLDRYWRHERRIAAELLARCEAGAPAPDAHTCAAGGPPGDDPDLQELAAHVALARRFTVVAGGPGTGKTTTVARIVALLDEQALGPAGGRATPPRVALAAPTGKAAARLQEAVHDAAGTLDVSPATRARLLGTTASTVHRLLGWNPGSHSRFRHHAGNRLPHDLVVVDEASMVSLSLMARLIEAVRPDARLVLVGDPDQLASVEAGAVLGDIVGPAADATIGSTAPAPAGARSAVAGGIVVLRRVHRFAGSIARLADAVRRGDVAATLAVLHGDNHDVSWVDADLADPSTNGRLAPVHDRAVSAGRALHDAAVAGDDRGALDALGLHRVLCAHRHGPYGVSTWMPAVEGWLAGAIDGYAAGGTWYAGRPLLVTENDYGLRLYNGDTGVVVAGPERARAVFERKGRPVSLSPSRLGAVETVHAMTVHKSQGSQFGAVAVLLPDETSPLLTRELLYTAATRAQHHLTIVGTEAAVRAAVGRPIARASGLRERLWGAGS